MARDEIWQRLPISQKTFNTIIEINKVTTKSVCNFHDYFILKNHSKNLNKVPIVNSEPKPDSINQYILHFLRHLRILGYGEGLAMQRASKPSHPHRGAEPSISDKQTIDLGNLTNL